MSVNTEFNSIHAYFSDDSEDLVLNRRSSLLMLNKLGSEIGQAPSAPLMEEENEKKQMHKQYKHEIHQKVRWYKLLFQISNILKW